MPWMVDKNGEEYYKASMYVKEELPTWNEVYNVWYKQKMFTFDSEKDSKPIDPYWKIPVKKYLLATVCNQFNKMIFEDNYPLPENCKYLSFSLTRNYPSSEYGNVGDPPYAPPVIYSFKNPNGYSNPFITKYPRIDITGIDKMKIYPLITSNTPPAKIIDKEDEINLLIDYMIKPFKEYFENGVGWKDNEGNNISETDKGKDYNRAADPAL